MLRRSRLILGAVLVIAAACSAATPTTPAPLPNTLVPGDFGPSMSGGDSTCRSGWGVQNGKSC